MCHIFAIAHNLNDIKMTTTTMAKKKKVLGKLFIRLDHVLCILHVMIFEYFNYIVRNAVWHYFLSCPHYYELHFHRSHHISLEATKHSLISIMIYWYAEPNYATQISVFFGRSCFYLFFRFCFVLDQFSCVYLAKLAAINRCID